MFSESGLQVIKNEILNDPEGRGYFGKTDLEISILMNEPISTKTPAYQFSAVNPQSIVEQLVRLNEWKIFKDKTVDNEKAFNFLALSELGQISVSLGEAELKQLIDDLASVGVLSAEATATLQNLGKVEIKKSRAEIIIGGPVRESDISEANRK